MVKFQWKRKQKQTAQELLIAKEVQRVISERGLMSKDDIKQYLDDIKKDERKRRIWESLPDSKKLELLRYVAKNRRLDNEKPSKGFTKRKA